MKKRFGLQTLLDLAQIRSDGESRKLAAVKEQWQQAEQKLQQLLRSRVEYEHRFRDSSARGMPSGALHEYRIFLRRLDQTIAAERQLVAERKAAWEACQTEWFEHRRKYKAFDTLFHRHENRENRLDVHTQQRDHDEFAQTWTGRKPREQ